MKQLKKYLKTLQYIYYNEDCTYELAVANSKIFPVFTFLCIIFLSSQFIYDSYFFVKKNFDFFYALYIIAYLLSFLLLVTTNAKIKNAQVNFIQHIDDIMDTIDRFSIIFLICVACISILDIFHTGSLQSLTIGCMALSFLYFRPRKILPTFAINCILVYLFSAAYRGISISKCNILFHNFITTSLLFLFILLKYYLKIQLELSKKESQKFKDRLNQATLSKTKFLSNVTRYLDVPTTHISTAVKESQTVIAKDAAMSHTLSEISTYTEEISCFINNIKEMNALESNHSLFTSETTCFPVFMEKIGEIFKILCEAKNQKFVMDFHDIRHHYVYLNSNHLKQILLNLIMNAISYTPMGGYIHVTLCELEDMTGVLPRYQFIIEDNGIGMTDEFISKIYYPFERAEDIVLDEVSGAGIGMTVVKHLLDELHGTIDISSIPNVGTEITISLDLNLSAEPKKEVEESSSTTSSNEIAS